MHKSIKAHGSESQPRRAKKSKPMRQTSELFVRSTAVKLANALNKPL